MPTPRLEYNVQMLDNHSIVLGETGIIKAKDLRELLAVILASSWPEGSVSLSIDYIGTEERWPK